MMAKYLLWECRQVSLVPFLTPYEDTLSDVKTLKVTAALFEYILGDVWKPYGEKAAVAAATAAKKKEEEEEGENR